MLRIDSYVVGSISVAREFFLSFYADEQHFLIVLVLVPRFFSHAQRELLGEKNTHHFSGEAVRCRDKSQVAS